MNGRSGCWRILALSGAALALVGCGSRSSGGDAGAAETPATSAEPTADVAPPDKPVSTTLLPSPNLPVVRGQFSPEVVWRGDTLIVTAFGSSLCQPVAKDAAAGDTQTVVVTFNDPTAQGQACTDDYAPNRSKIPAPDGGIDVTDRVYAVFELPGAPLQRVQVQLLHPVLN